MILGTGPENAKIALVTDYPTLEESVNKRAFIGSSASYYDKMLKRQGSSLNQVYRTIFFKHEIPREFAVLLRKSKIKYPHTNGSPFNAIAEAAGAKLLEELLELKDCRFILAAGELPLNVLTKERKVGKFRGSILPIREDWAIANPSLRHLHVIPILPYRNVMQNILMEPVTSLDIGKAVTYAYKEQYVPFKRKYRISVAKTVREFNEFLQRHRNSKFWTSDFETLHNFPTCVSFCGDGKEAITVPLLGAKLPEDDKEALWFAVQEFYAWLARNTVPLLKRNNEAKLVAKGLINQNFNYDWTVAEKRNLAYGDSYGGDTLLYSHCIYPEFPRDLGFLTSIYTDIPYFKDEGKEFNPALHDFDRLYLYCAQDALATWNIHSEQDKDADDIDKTTDLKGTKGVRDFYYNFEAPMLLMYHSVERNGIRVDETQKLKLQLKYTSLLEQKKADVLQYADNKINFNSPKQVATFIYDYLNCPPKFKFNFDPETGTRTKVLATGEDEIEELAIIEKNEVKRNLLYGIIAIRKLTGILEFLATPNHSDGRMRTSVKLAGTKSGRTSGNKTIDYSISWDIKKRQYVKIPMGYSFQTIPKRGEKLPDGTRIGGDELRSIFVPDHNCIFLEGDKSQAEARIVCVLSNDFNLLPLFDDKKIGIHRTTASWIYNVDPSTISKKEDDRYDIGKRARHAGNYGMTPIRLALMAHISLAMAEFILNKFHGAQPNIRNVFHKSVETCMNKEAVMINPFGRRRPFYGRKDESTIKEAYAQYPQSTQSDDLKRSAFQLWQNVQDYAKILAEQHDSLFLQTHKDNKNKLIDQWKIDMEQPIDFRKGTFPRDIELTIPTELKWSDYSWGDMQDVK